jgi:hypothetical protein
LERAKGKLRDLYTSLLEDGITADEQVIVGLIETLLGGIDSVIAEAAAQAQEEAAAKSAAAKRRRDTASLDIALNDRDGADAFVADLGKYGDALRTLFGAFDLTTLSGIEAATDALRGIAGELEAMTDEEIVARFGLTRDEIVSAILDLDGGLDDLAGGMRDLADAATDFLYDINQEYLDAIGMGLDAQLLAIQKWVDDMIAEATRLGVLTDETLKQINAIAESRKQAARDRFAPPEEAAAEAPTDTTSSTRSRTQERLTGLSEVFGIRLLDYAASQLVEIRATRVAAVRIADGLFGSGVPQALTVPALPAGTGTSGGGAQFVFHINIGGSITGNSAREAARELVREITPLLNDALGRVRGIDQLAAGRIVR